MDEEVLPEHVLDDHSANQLIERVAWAVCDATDAKQQLAPDGRRRAVPTMRKPSHAAQTSPTA
jgi:hypothetical protein